LPCICTYRVDRESQARAQSAEKSGLIIDFAADGRAIGIEITSPTRVTLAALYAVLSQINEPPITTDEIAPPAV
jgi:hypothetical protein